MLMLVLLPIACFAVESLTGSALDGYISEGKSVFVKFFSPSCPHCVRMAPVWEELSQSSPDNVIADIDCTKNRDVCKRFDVQGVPSLQFIKNGKVCKYSGNRDLESLVNFATNGYSEASCRDLPVPEIAKSYMTLFAEAVVEIFEQLNAMARYSPLACALLFMMGVFMGASVTGILVTVTRSSHEHPKAEDKDEKASAKELKPVKKD